MILSIPALFFFVPLNSAKHPFLDLLKKKNKTQPPKQKEIDGQKQLNVENNPHRRFAITGNFSLFWQQSSPKTNPQPQISSPLTPSKSNSRFLLLLLQALIMTFIISHFFVLVSVAAIIFLHLCIVGGALHLCHT